MAASCAMRLTPATPQLARRAGASRASARPVLPFRSAQRTNVAVHASQNESALQAVGLKVEQVVAVTTAVSTFLMAGNASAAQEIAALAADNRLGAISLLFVPVLGWVGFNILGPAFRQLESMSSDSAPKKGTSKTTKRRSVAAVVGAGLLAASMLSAGSADAATEVAQLADSDGRLAAILTLFVPAIGWVLFNILGPAQRQLESMSGTEAPKATKTLRKRGLAAGLGMSAAAASLMVADSASAATEVAQLADSDGRLAAILTLFVPAVGWVLFNILGPAQRQLESMASDGTPKKATKRRGVAAAVGMGAAAMTMMAAESANAATEFAQVADSDGRLAAILTLFVPAVGWVLFNILGPAQRQLESMASDGTPKKATKGTKRRGVAAGLGMSAAAASLVLADSASAATEFAQVADSDGRLAAILTLFVPAVAWVLFNILGPAQRQLESMASDGAPKKATKRRGVAAAVGMGAAAMSMVAVESANAATEVAQLADSDGRLAAILTLFVPALGWVAFNMFGPALRQLESMSAPEAPKKGTVRRK